MRDSSPRYLRADGLEQRIANTKNKKLESILHGEESENYRQMKVALEMYERGFSLKNIKRVHAIVTI